MATTYTSTEYSCSQIHDSYQDLLVRTYHVTFDETAGPIELQAIRLNNDLLNICLMDPRIPLPTGYPSARQSL